MARDPDILDSGSGTWWREEPRRGAVPGGGGGRREVASRPIGRAGDEAAGAAQEVGRPPQRPHRRRSAAAVVGALLVGVVLGAVGQDRLDEAREQARATATVAVALEDEALASIQSDPVTPSFTYRFEIRNGGPRPVEVVDATLRGDPLSMDALVAPVAIPAGGRAAVRLSGSVDCGAMRGPAPPPVTLVVGLRTEDGRRHERALGGKSSPTRRDILGSCADEPPVSVQSVDAEVTADVAAVRLAVHVPAPRRLRITAASLEPAQGFTLKHSGLPLLLSAGAGGRVYVLLGVADCGRALDFDPAKSQLLLWAGSGSVRAASVPVPDGMAVAMVRLAERYCTGDTP